MLPCRSKWFYTRLLRRIFWQHFDFESNKNKLTKIMIQLCGFNFSDTIITIFEMYWVCIQILLPKTGPRKPHEQLKPESWRFACPGTPNASRSRAKCHEHSPEPPASRKNRHRPPGCSLASSTRYITTVVPSWVTVEPAMCDPP
jgi:hypothetical protein